MTGEPNAGAIQDRGGRSVAVRWQLSAIYNGNLLNNRQSRSLPDAKLNVLIENRGCLRGLRYEPLARLVTRK